MKRPDPRIIEIKEREESQHKNLKNIIKKNCRIKLHYLKKDIPIKVKEAYRTPNRLDQKRKFTCHIIIKALKLQNKETLLRLQKKIQSITQR